MKRFVIGCAVLAAITGAAAAGKWDDVFATHPELQLPQPTAEPAQVFARLVQIEQQAVDCSARAQLKGDARAADAENALCTIAPPNDSCLASEDAVDHARLFFDRYYVKTGLRSGTAVEQWARSCNRKLIRTDTEIAGLDPAKSCGNSLLLLPIVQDRINESKQRWNRIHIAWGGIGHVLPMCAKADLIAGGFGSRCARIFREYGIGRRLSVWGHYTDVDWGVCRVFARGRPDASMKDWGMVE